MPSTKINLTTTDAYSDPISVYAKNSMVAQVNISPDYSWSSAVVGMEWSVTMDDNAAWNTFSPVVSFTNSTPAVVNIDIASMPYVRFRVTTAEGASDPHATVVYMTE